MLFDFRKTTDSPLLLLILDRRSDAITPLLSQWTYQAMVHELIGIRNGRVSIPNQKEEIVLSSFSDSFYAKNRLCNFGDLGNAIKDFVKELEGTSTSVKKLETIADMKKFVEELPEYRKLSSNVSKHVNIMSELSRLVEKNNLLQISEIEQNISVAETASDHNLVFKV